MDSYCCVKIGYLNFSCTTLQQTNNVIILKDKKYFNELNSLKNYIKNKKNINFLLFETNFLKYCCSLNKKIKARISINQMLSLKNI